MKNKKNDEIDYSLVANSSRVDYRTTHDTLVGRVRLKLAHYRIMTNPLLFRMNLVANLTRGHCLEVETIMHAFFHVFTRLNCGDKTHYKKERKKDSIFCHVP